MTLDHCAMFNGMDFICYSEKESSPLREQKGMCPVSLPSQPPTKEGLLSLSAIYSASIPASSYLHTEPKCYIQTSSTLPCCPNPSGGQPVLNQGNHANGNPLASNWLHRLGFSQSVACITLQLRTNQFLVSTLLFKGRREDALAVETGLFHKPQSFFLSLPSVGITIRCHGGKIS